MREKLNILRKELSQENIFCFTMDTDWASEYAIEKTIAMYSELGIKPTVFATNKSYIIEESARRKIIDVGIHPNFVNGSSQGNTDREIIQYCIDNIPKTQAFRCHRWYAVNDIYDLLYDQGFRYESNQCTDLDLVSPYIHRSGMICFPVFMEDGAYILHERSLKFSDVQYFFEQDGLKIINIHPMHFMLNTPYFSYTRNVKDSVSREKWNQLDEDSISKLRFSGRGISDFIRELTEYATRKCKIVTMKELYNRIIEE